MEKDKTLIKIGFLGDICLARKVYSAKAESLLSQEVIEVLNDCDFVVANLESVLVKERDANFDHLSFQGNSSLLVGLRSVNLFGLANNHINDFGDTGIENTIKCVEENNFRHAD